MIALDTQIQYLKGVGEKRAQLYHKLGIDTIGQLLYHLPRSYLDASHPVPVLSASPEEPVMIRAVVLSKGREQHIRKGLSVFKVQACDDSGPIVLTFFNTKYTVDCLHEDQEYFFYGRVTGSARKKEMSSPLVFPLKLPSPMIPIYPLTQGLTSRMISACVLQSLSLLDETLPDPLPQAIRQQYSLCHLHYALKNIHLPEDCDAVQLARKRLVFEELFILALSLATVKSRRTGSTAFSCEKTELSPFLNRLPFEPTGAQKRTIEELCRDMSGQVPMNRLVQGDVGSGKTIVAAAGLYLACQNGFQGALMAPTEILAHQHYDTLSGLLEPLGIHTVLLTGSKTAKEKRLIKAAIADGSAQVIIGTHAILSDDVEFHRLALVVTDEQHRFGVAQRTKLQDKTLNPHILVMSATPIPRTLALMIYGDLDVSILDELPPGRQPIETFVIDSKKRSRAYHYIKDHLDRGLQAYIVCPLVEAGDNPMGLINVSDYAAKIAAEDFSGYEVGLLHGKMKPKDKDAVMEKFKNGQIQVLVSTTVIEVGVDVPNAVIMMIENAERFGLSQLHQLRGRVGRGTESSTCILVSDNDNPQTQERLSVMHRSRDGFKIAEYDLKARGPGDFLGMRQHGLPQLKIADLAEDMELLNAARQAADSVMAHQVQMTPDEHRRLVLAVKTMLHNVGDRPN